MSMSHSSVEFLNQRITILSEQTFKKQEKLLQQDSRHY
jgi:hypothetical protein